MAKIIAHLNALTGMAGAYSEARPALSAGRAYTASLYFPPAERPGFDFFRPRRKVPAAATTLLATL